MRKQTKLVAVLSAAALLAVGASMTSFAAQGWQEENGTWVYYDKDGYTVTDTWKKSGNNWFYLNEDGEMAISTLIENDDNTYYVNENGVMVANQWVQLENENYYDSNDSDEEPETVWYYFQSTGKAYKGGASTSFKDINGKKYAFDQDGKMLFGWVGETSERITGDDAYQTGVYYCGDFNDGARVSNAWANLYVSDKGPDVDELEDQEYLYFWFQTNGKKYAAPDGDGLKDKKINGKYYSFDEQGVMRAEWQSAASESSANEAKYYSDIDNGARQKGWFQAVPAEWINGDANADESKKWYYGDSNGKLTTSQIKTINGKKYLFNASGEMLTGLRLVTFKGDSLTEVATITNIDKADQMDKWADTLAAGGKVYYFSSTSDDGSLKTGVQNVTVDGDTYQFSFDKEGADKGQGLTESDKVLYVSGRKIKADSDYKYQVFNKTTGEEETMKTGETVSADDYVIVNTSGSIMKGTSAYKDADGNYYRYNKEAKTITYSTAK